MAEIDPDRTIANVGQRIAELRIKRGWTQAQFAEEAGMSLKYIQRIEAGRTNLTIRSLVSFANILETRLTELFRATKGRPPGPGRPKRA